MVYCKKLYWMRSARLSVMIARANWPSISFNCGNPYKDSSLFHIFYPFRIGIHFLHVFSSVRTSVLQILFIPPCHGGLLAAKTGTISGSLLFWDKRVFAYQAAASWHREMIIQVNKLLSNHFMPMALVGAS